MNEDVKELPKRYKVEDILKSIKSEGEPVYPTPKANDWIKNPTKFKLREAEYFLNNTRRAYRDYIHNTTDENHDVLLFNLSAFLSSIRSVTGNYMQKQYDHKPGFSEWYLQQHLGDDPEIRFLNNVRVEFVHVEPHTMTTERGLICRVATRIVYADDDPRKKTVPPLPETLPPEEAQLQIKTFDVIFKLNDEMIKRGLKKDLPVLDFCTRNYKKIMNLVIECENRFNTD